MMQGMNRNGTSAEIVYREPFPPVLRVVLGLIGLMLVVLVPWDLAEILWPPSLFTLFFGAIVLGAFSVGLAFIAGALSSPETLFRVTPGQLLIDEKTPFGRRRHRLAAIDISAFEIVTRTWDSMADTFAVRIRTRDDRQFHLPDRTTRSAAEAMQREIEAMLSRTR